MINKYKLFKEILKMQSSVKSKIKKNKYNFKEEWDRWGKPKETVNKIP
ncbi:hypothetical protein [Tepidibacter formicigenes]|jgi:hypothetical protein|uniref:Uncharacterized protein n=1 Tax=Tepidibacter formicigenes DSM 15518 TaxID=1123349 RepID=A0A1M6N8F2_9FIRM|nr:hypothetical protein [Tepidibacter formicigenes]SHJ91951.1 hypothetical protein SAMN02744037_01182 [Tepidibacter formicigenes DSM 15518]